MNEEDDCPHDEHEDIDVHRYRCTDCGKVFYYSARAEKAYTTGDFSELP